MDVHGLKTSLTLPRILPAMFLTSLISKSEIWDPCPFWKPNVSTSDAAQDHREPQPETLHEEKAPGVCLQRFVFRGKFIQFIRRNSENFLKCILEIYSKKFRKFSKNLFEEISKIFPKSVGKYCTVGKYDPPRCRLSRPSGPVNQERESVHPYPG